MKKDEKEDNGVVLTKESRYRIKSLESRDHPLITSGKFIGYTAIGHDEGMAMELDETHEDKKGHIRVVPTHTIVCIDIIEAVEKEEKKEQRSSTMYG